MPNCRAFVPGGCWFFTVNLLERRQNLLLDHIEVLRAAIAKTRNKYPFEIDAVVVLPDHLHAVWTLPHGEPISRPVGVSSRSASVKHCRSGSG